MLILGIESSCDETAVAVVRDGREIITSKIRSQIETHKIYGGVVPEIASRAHTECISQLCREALTDANVEMQDISAIAVTAYPGLIGALLVGVNFAKGLSLSSGLPLIPVHHLRGHVASNYIAFPNLEPPFICLIVSGGHTSLVKVNGFTSFETIGRTRDDAAGECFDKVARVLGLPYPGGVEMDKLASTGNEAVFSFPRANVKDSPFDFSFSGLKTAAINILHNSEQKGEIIHKADFAASFSKAVTDALVSRLFTCAKEQGIKKVAIAGGVSANSMLRKKASDMAEAEGFELYVPPLSLSGDNAAMIAAQGYYEFLDGNIANFSLNAEAVKTI